jgi:hypothetical protein
MVQLALLGGLALLVMTIALSVLAGAAVAVIGREGDTLAALAAAMRHGTAFATVGVLSASGVALATLLDLAVLVASARAGLLWVSPGWSTLVTTLVGLPAALCALLFGYSGLLALARLARRDLGLGTTLDGLLELGAALLVVLRSPWRTLTVASAVGMITSPLVVAALIVGPAILAEPLSWSTLVLHLFVGLCLAATIVCAALAFDRALPHLGSTESPQVRLPAAGGPDAGH